MKDISSNRGRRVPRDRYQGDYENAKHGKKRKKFRTRKQKVVKAIVIILVILLLLGVGAYFFFTSTIGLNKDSVNILVCGIDNEKGRSQMNSDVMMVVNLDVKQKKVSILQIPRDTWVGPQETYYGKINGIFARSESGGIKGLAKYLKSNLKIDIDHYATVTMDTFIEVIDGIGGVEMDVPATIKWEGVKVKKGKQNLTGRQAQIFVRKRKGADVANNPNYKDGDMSRIKMQRLFMAAFAKEMKSLNFFELINVVQTALPNIKTDISLNEARMYANFLRGVKLNEMTIRMLPGKATTAYPNGVYQSVYSLHKKQTVKMLNKYFRPHSPKITEADVNILEIQNQTPDYNDTEQTFGELAS